MEGRDPQRTTPERLQSDLVRSVSRALDVIEALDAESLGLAELGRRTGLRPSTTHRMLATLSERGYVRRRPSGQYELGIRASALGSRLRVRQQLLVDAAGPVLTRVNMVAKETASLAVLEGWEVVVVADVAERRSAHALDERDVRIPVHASASGKAMLAYTDLELWTRDRSLDTKLMMRFTDNTLIDREQLLADLSATRARGFALDHNEYREGISCLAAPVFDDTGHAIAALGISGRSSRMRPGTYADLGELAARSALEVSHALGFEAR
jgi:IclR family acetate operon transcriptional repressor